MRKDTHAEMFDCNRKCQIHRENLKKNVLTHKLNKPQLP